VITTRGIFAGAERLPRTARADNGQCVRWYSVFGLRIRSDIALPVAAATNLDGLVPDLVLVRSRTGRHLPEPDGPLVAALPCPFHGIDLSMFRGPTGTWLSSRLGWVCRISPDARSVEVFAEDGVDEQDLGIALAGQVAIMVLHQRGYLTLHASAAVTEFGVVAFLGDKGHGKSTMAAAFLRRGAALVTDDVLPLSIAADGVYGTPSLPLMKLWRESAEGTLALTDELPNVVSMLDKKLLSLAGRYRFAEAPARMRALYLLERYDAQADSAAQVTIRRLNGRAGLKALLANVSQPTFLLPTEVGGFLPLCSRLLQQAPVCVLRYPSGFEYQESVHARILADLAAVARQRI
jgi:hypothetical protein